MELPFGPFSKSGLVPQAGNSPAFVTGQAHPFLS